MRCACAVGEKNNRLTKISGVSAGNVPVAGRACDPGILERERNDRVGNLDQRRRFTVSALKSKSC